MPIDTKDIDPYTPASPVDRLEDLPLDDDSNTLRYVDNISWFYMKQGPQWFRLDMIAPYTVGDDLKKGDAAFIDRSQPGNPKPIIRKHIEENLPPAWWPPGSEVE